MDGVTLCGARTYSYFYLISPVNTFTTQTTVTEPGDNIRFAPLTSTDQGTYTMTLSACLTTYIASCYTQNVVITINPCQVISSTKTGGNVATVSYAPYAALLTYTFPTYT
jgi:hypothetical protein